MKERKPPGNPGSDESMDPTPMKKGKGQAALGRDIGRRVPRALDFEHGLEPVVDVIVVEPPQVPVGALEERMPAREDRRGDRA